MELFLYKRVEIIEIWISESVFGMNFGLLLVLIFLCWFYLDWWFSSYFGKYMEQDDKSDEH